MQSRDSSIDSIRSLGLFCVILAHVNPPFVLFQLRNFDVPLMVFLSGYLFGNRGVRLEGVGGFLQYLGKRFVRLVLPVWLFICLYLLIQYFFPSYFRVLLWNYPEKIWSSFKLMEGIGYVWIIRVFLYIAVLGPLLQRYIQSKERLLLFYLAFELLVGLVLAFFTKQESKLFTESVLYSLGYLVFFLLGTQYQTWTSKQRLQLALGMAVLLLGGITYYSYLGSAVDLQLFKYPPRFLYTYYALLCISFIFALKPWIERCSNFFLDFVGSSTIWIYLWHILFLQLVNTGSWYWDYPLILGLSMLLCYVQQQLVYGLIRWGRLSEGVSKQLRIILCS